MEKLTLLTQFEYSILPSAIALTGTRKHHAVAEHLPLMKVVIDFTQGSLKLEGDWCFMISSNKYNEASWFNYHRGRVKIETEIFASSTIDLDNTTNDSLVFALDGSIKEGNSLFPCSGLLVLDNDHRIAGLTGHRWSVSFYLYDLQFDNCEIKFTLPILTTSSESNKN